MNQSDTVYKCIKNQTGEVYYSEYEQDAQEIEFDYLSVIEVPRSEVPPFGIAQLANE